MSDKQKDVCYINYKRYIITLTSYKNGENKTNRQMTTISKATAINNRTNNNNNNKNHNNNNRGSNTNNGLDDDDNNTTSNDNDINNNNYYNNNNTETLSSTSIKSQYDELNVHNRLENLHRMNKGY